MCIMKQPLRPWKFTFRHSDWQQLKLVLWKFFRDCECQLKLFAFYSNPESTLLETSTKWTFFFLGSLENISTTEASPMSSPTFAVFHRKSTFSCLKIDFRGAPVGLSCVQNWKWFAFRLKTWQKLFQSFANTDLIQKMKHQQQSRSGGVSTLRNFTQSMATEFNGILRIFEKRSKVGKHFNLDFSYLKLLKTSSIISTSMENRFSQESDQNSAGSHPHSLTRPRSSPNSTPEMCFLPFVVASICIHREYYVSHLLS